MERSDSIIYPGSWLGVLGGGQLGRMFSHAAQSMGYHVATFEPEVASPAAQAADRHFCETSSGESAESLVSEMAKCCSAITLEFENIDAGLVRIAAEHSLTRPGVDFLEICQDRVKEKSSLSEAGFPTTPFCPVSSESEVHKAAEKLGWPLVLKTARSGYDGKGQRIVRDASAVASAWKDLDDTHSVAEQWIEFDAEVSMIAARNASGEIVCYPLLENDHANHILDITVCPANLGLQRYAAEATEICRGIADKFNVVGLFCVEFFCATNGQLMINEMAPRPHNSGHLTIEAFNCSQFEQQVRAICNLPLVQPEQIRPAAMANLLGDLWGNSEPKWTAAMQHPAAHLHLYGKSEARPGRKMGHLTIVQETAPEMTARQLRDELQGSD